jgi:hypothetical protein
MEVIKMKKLIILFMIISYSCALSFSGNGSGTEEDPYQITDVYELQEIDEEMYAHYILLNDIDASDTQNWNVGDHDNDPNTPDSAMGFRPIFSFEGSLNGNGHIIKNLHINRPLRGSCLIKVGWSNAYVINLGIEDCYISGGLNTAALIGVAEQLFRIEKCYSTGTIISPIGRPEGLAGLIATNKYARIINCYSRCEVISNKPPVDDLDGLVASFCTGVSNVRGCYTTGKVSLPDNDIKVYPFGIFTDFNNTGCYWDIETTGISTEGIPDDHANGRTTEEMMKKSTYKGWDFENVWCIDEGNDYPKLRVFGDCPPVGVEDISDVQSLNAYVYPNPAKDMINLSIKNEIPSSLKIEIYDSMGNKLKKVIDSPYFPAESYKNIIDVSDLPSGIYYFTLRTGSDTITKQSVKIR